MKLDEFTFSLALLAFPGIVTYMILKRVVPQSKESNFEIFLKIFVYSILSYVIYAAAQWGIANLPCAEKATQIEQIKFFDRKSIGIKEILGATISALALSIFFSYALTYNWLNRLFRKIYASKRSGDKDLWTFYHNIPEKQKNGGWVFVRDHEKEIVYYGAVVGWSESSEGNKEIILSNVDVYAEKNNGETELLYQSDVIYLNKLPEHLSIEVPAKQPNDTENETIEPEQQEPEQSEPI